VRAGAFTPHVERKGEPLTVHPGDAEWFKENVGCRFSCPVSTDVPRYLALIAEGKFKEAYEVNKRANLFPEILGRVCHRPCEAACRRGLLDEPVAICHLKRFTAYAAGLRPAADEVLRTQNKPRFTLSESRKRGRVAVVGSGPAGLAAAWELIHRGYEVTIYEAQEEAGGLLRWGIPPYRLPKELVEGAISEFYALGVEVVTAKRIEQDQLDELLAQYDAVLLAVGALQPLKLGIPGEEAQGVIDGLFFMHEINGGRGEALGVRGKKVAVIGGGFTALDCARSSIRLGAREVMILYRRTRAEMPAFGDEIEQAEEEGIRIEELVSPLEVSVEDGCAKGLRLIRNRLGEPDESGRPRPIPIEGTEFELKADLVITAIGQERDPSLFTSRPGLFLAGDFLTGPRTVIEAIETGRRAAAAIEQHLHGGTQKPKDPALKEAVPAWTKKIIEGRPAHQDEGIPRRPMPTLPVIERTLTAEVELGYSEEEARAEASRCYQCQLNLFVEAEECILCNKCVEACPHDCLSIVSFSIITGELPGLEEAKGWLDGGALILDETLCTRCGECIESCPPKCMRLEYFHWEGSEDGA
jgi:formate dehydrogenase major subunit